MIHRLEICRVTGVGLSVEVLSPYFNKGALIIHVRLLQWMIRYHSRGKGVRWWYDYVKHYKTMEAND